MQALVAIELISIYKFSLSVCLFICLSVCLSPKKLQNGRTDWAHVLCGCIDAQKCKEVSTKSHIDIV